MTLLSLIAAGCGVGLMVAAYVAGRRSHRRFLMEALDLHAEEPAARDGDEGEPGVLAERAIGMASKAVERLDARGGLRNALEQARIPLRPGEYLIVWAAAGLSVAAFLLVVTGQWVMAGAGMAFTGAAAVMFVKLKISRRRKAFQRQLPGALSLVASSLAAGHTFLRAVQMMCEESEPPLSEEFSQVVHQTRLGDSVVDAMDRMAQRLGIRDLDWVVQAIRIQQTVGGRLAELLHTLADFIRSRDEVRREVLVLTAEGRMSAWVVGALPIMILLAIQVMNPGYMAPMFRGSGLIALGGCGVSVVIGILLIRRMSNIEV